MKKAGIQLNFSVHHEGEMLSSFDVALAKIRKKGVSSHLSNQFVSDLKLAYAEGVGNAIRHAKELEIKKHVKIEINVSPTGVGLNIFDHGAGFNIKKVKAPDFKSMLDSGRGVFLMRQLVDTVSYTRSKKHNVLSLKRSFIGLDPKLRDLDFILEMSSRLLLTEDAASIYRLILERAADVFGALKASILLYDPIERKLKLAASRGITKKVASDILVRPGEGIAGYVFKHQKPCLIENMNRNVSGWKKKRKYKSSSFISAPLFYHSPETRQLESVGVINMTDRKNGKTFTKKDLLLLTAIANQAAACLYLKNLLSKATEAESMKREFEIAGKIHQHYLPKSFPQYGDIDVYGACDTAVEVGGDYYDVMSINADETFFVMADVSGHNLAASLTMANFRSQLKAILMHETKPDKILTLLNTSLHDDLLQSDQFITMVLAHYQHSSKTLKISSAGHFFPYLKRANNIVAIADYQMAGLALGIKPKEDYQTVQVLLKTSDSLLFYTDGMIECDNPDGERFGLGRLSILFKSIALPTAKEILTQLMEQVNLFCRDKKRTDDASSLILRIKK